MTVTIDTVLPSPSPEAPLADWLSWLETIHPVSIDMGLERVGLVADRLQMRPVSKPLILVGGTNGKGSTVSMLTEIYRAAGYHVGSYTSPHIDDFRERIQINGEMAEAKAIVDALAYVEHGRAPQTLTYFEYTTLAAMRVFQQQHCDVYILEVGLGGRLDATNLWDADCSVVTSIALDHEEYLGSDRSVIATEKAAIGRRGKVLVVGDQDPPASLQELADEQGILVEYVGAFAEHQLPKTSLVGLHQRRNAACAVAVTKHLAHKLPVDQATCEEALLNVSIPARFESLLYRGIPVLLDVAHNPAGAQALASAWSERYPTQQAHIIFACLGDKDIEGIVSALAPFATHWHTLPLHGPRSLSGDVLAERVRAILQNRSTQPAVPVTSYTSASEACDSVFRQIDKKTQALLVAGSFFTISDVRGVLDAAVSN